MFPSNPALKGSVRGCYTSDDEVGQGAKPVSPRNRILPYDPSLRSKARALRKNSTLGEVLLWKAIRRKALGCEFHRQVAVGNYIVDFFCHEHMLAIEIDGRSHSHPDTCSRDIARQRELEEMGVRFLRFRERDVRSNLPRVVNVIASWICENSE